MFAEILLPLPLYATFTYSIPDEMTGQIQTGSRVLVQFGKKKYYTGIVVSTHSDKPAGYDVKPVMAILDSAPVIRYPQLKLWNWIADYYLCSPGEVYKAAVPTGLKPESETFISLNEDFECPDGIRLTDYQAMVVQMLQENKKLKISDIESKTKIKGAARIINSLLEADIIHVSEKIVERYKPATVKMIELCADRNDHDKLHDFFDAVNRARQQEKALMAYLDLSGWLRHTETLRDVPRDELVKATGITPGVLKNLIDKGIFKIVKKTINRFNSESEKLEEPKLSPLSDEQENALTEIGNIFRNDKIALLHGVTGSGKTEVYSHLIAKALTDRSQILYLVPEISLTTQLTDRLRKIFGNRLIVYHSKFSDNERVDIWKRMLTSAEPLIILGARSSVFLPFAHLGLVVIDEEHEASFKQYDPAPRYNARDVAIMLATMHGAKVVLGSATPSIETYYKAITGKYGLAEIRKRFEGAQLPEVKIVDMREQRKKRLNDGILSSTLKTAVSETLSEGKQAIMFQNRRGFAPVVVCRQCGWTPKCHNCDVSLIYHKRTNLLTCHYCGFCQPLPKLCPACGMDGIEIFGYGTERIAEEIHSQFPDRRVARMDLDTTRNKDAYQEIIEEFSRADTDILVGTQMVSKGLDFEQVSLVGVLNADMLLNFPDFRSNERAFNMLEQVAGRAGRRHDKGKVIIQTTNPEDPVISFVKSHDYNAFYNSEIEERRKYSYPPFTRIINIYIKNKNAQDVDLAALTFTKKLKETFGERVLGPEKPYVSRIALWYIQSIMLKIEAGASMKKVKDLLRRIHASLVADPKIKNSIIYYDVDPV